MGVVGADRNRDGVVDAMQSPYGGYGNVMGYGGAGAMQRIFGALQLRAAGQGGMMTPRTMGMGGYG